MTLCILILALASAAAQDKKGADSSTKAADAAANPADTKPVSETDLPIYEAGQTGGTSAAAAANPAATAAAPAASTVSIWEFVRMILILACVVGAIYLVFFMLKRGSRKRIQENDLIKVLGSRALSGSRALHLVEAAGGVYLIGSSDGGVQLIAEITDKENLDTLKLKAAEQGPAVRRSFQDVLADIFRPAKKASSLAESIELLKGQRERLRKM